MLLIVAGLVCSQRRQSRQIGLGFDPDQVIDVHIDVKQIGYTDQQGTAFFREVEERLRALPGVVSVGQAFSVPMGLMSADERLTIEEHPVESGQPEPTVFYNMVSPGLFRNTADPTAPRPGIHQGRL